MVRQTGGLAVRRIADGQQLGAATPHLGHGGHGIGGFAGLPDGNH